MIAAASLSNIWVWTSCPPSARKLYEHPIKLSMNSKLLLCLNLVFGISLVAILLILLSDGTDMHRGGGQPNATIREAQIIDEVEALRRDLRASSNLGGAAMDEKMLLEIAALKSKIAQLSIGQSDAHDEGANELPTTEELEQQRLDAIERKRQRDANLVAQFEDQPVDDIWSPETASKMDQLLIDPKLVDLGFSTPECKTNMCKVDIQFSDDQDKNEEAEFYLLTQVSGYLPRAKAVRNADGTISYYFIAETKANAHNSRSPTP